MFKKLKPETKERVIAYSLAGIIVVAFYLFISHINVAWNVLLAIFSALTPFIYGVVFAFLLMPFRNLCEKKLMKNLNWKDSTKRKVAVFASIILLILILVGFFLLIVPQLISSIGTFVKNLSGYIQNVQTLIDQINLSDSSIFDGVIDMLYTAANSLTSWLTGASGGLTKLVGYVSDMVYGVINFLIGIIVAMYILFDSETFGLQMKKVIYCLLPKNTSDELIKIGHLTADMFYKFISGKAVDSLIIGIICYIGCIVMDMPYAVLIAVVVGITNMIPVFGPFIGAIPCLVILVMIDWVKAAEFLVFIIVLQQCDGNIIGPYILGDAVGLPTLWVMFAIIVGGALFGVVGMFIGVPTFAVIYILVKQLIYDVLKKKNLNFDGEEKE